MGVLLLSAFFAIAFVVTLKSQSKVEMDFDKCRGVCAYARNPIALSNETMRARYSVCYDREQEAAKVGGRCKLTTGAVKAPPPRFSSL